MRSVWLMVAALFLAACTTGPAPGEAIPTTTGPAVRPTDAPADPAEEIVLPVLASLTGPTTALDAAFLDGMRLAEREVNRGDGMDGARLRLDIGDDGGLPESAEAAIPRLLPLGPALVVVGPAGPVTANRTAIERAARPVFVLGGDLYSEQQLFRWSFQTSPPLRWQARVTGRYFARDREHATVLVVATTEAAAQTALEELTAEGVAQPTATVLTSIRDASEIANSAAGLDAVLALVPPSAAARLATALSTLRDSPQLAVSSDSLGRAGFPPGTVAPYLYSWAGWADPIPRVARFRDRFTRLHDHAPASLEQEGYDAVMLIAAALSQANSESGEPLLAALHQNRPEGPVHSSLPLTLGPDDHTTIDETWLGMFAMAHPDDAIEPWLPPGAPWRPVIRSFSYDGERTVFHEPDRRVFFPFWRHGRPSPKYFRSALGIATRPEDDPLH